MVWGMSGRRYDADLERTQINHAVFCKRLVIEANFCFGTSANHRACLMRDSRGCQRQNRHADGYRVHASA